MTEPRAVRITRLRLPAPPGRLGKGQWCELLVPVQSEETFLGISNIITRMRFKALRQLDDAELLPLRNLTHENQGAAHHLLTEALEDLHATLL